MKRLLEYTVHRLFFDTQDALKDSSGKAATFEGISEYRKGARIQRANFSHILIEVSS